jgi:protocatechuate 3,4-dioxygenase beta subunit
MPTRTVISSALAALGIAALVGGLLVVAPVGGPAAAHAATAPAAGTTTPTPTPSATPTDAPDPTGFPVPTGTATPSATPSASPTPTATASATPTPTPTASATPTPTSTPTPSPTASATPPAFAGETSISGRVTDLATGAPIAGASVYIYTASGAYGSAIPVTSTDADGNYVFYSLDVRSYTLEFTGTGFRTEWWGGEVAQDDAATFQVAHGEAVTGKDLALLPLDSISGTVTVAETPAVALADATVTAFGADGRPHGSTTTNTVGGYTLTGLTPGSYTLRFTPPAGSTAVAQWWHTTAKPTTAATVTLAADAAVTGKNAALAPGATISGRITDAKTGAVIAGAWVYAYVSGSGSGVSGGSIASARTDARGDYAFTGLAAGRYTLQFSGGSANGRAGYLREWWVNKGTRAKAVTFAVKAGATVADTDAALAPTATITGSVYAAGARNVGLNKATVSAMGTDGRLVRSTTTTSSGEYTLTGLPAGSYTLRFSAPAGTTFTAEWWHDDDATSGEATVIRVTAGQTVTGKTAELSVAR